MTSPIEIAPDARFVGVSQAHEVLGLSRSTVYLMLENGTLRSVRFGGRRLIPVEELDRFAKELAEKAR